MNKKQELDKVVMLRPERDDEIDEPTSRELKQMVNQVVQNYILAQRMKAGGGGKKVEIGKRWKKGRLKQKS